MKVRTTLFPDIELDVPEFEYLDLARQGLIVSDDPKDVGNQPVDAKPEPANNTNEENK